MEQYILAFDQGTTSSRAIIFDRHGAVISSAQKEFRQIFPKPGWVEHDPADIWVTQVSVAGEAVLKASLTVNDIIAIGITNQRETTIVWDRETHEPIHNAIVWQDRRTADYCDRLKKEGHSDLIKKKTGLVIDSYFSATKIRWILENVPGARKKATNGQLCFGTVDSWLLWKLTNGQVHATDISNASRTMLCNIHTGEWDEDLLKLFDIPLSMMPKIRSNSEVYGYTENVLTGKSIPVSGMAGDQQSALFGQMCIKPGMVKNTYGTGCFMLMNTGNKPIESKNNLLTTVAWKLDNEIQYALEGSVFIAGAVVQWLRDGLGVIGTSAQIEELTTSVDNNGGVFMVPAFAGLGAPYWDQHARGTIVGVTRGTTKGHLARAAIESIAYQTMDVLKAMEGDAGFPIAELRVDGGATINDLLMQFQADILNTKVVRPKITETTALGAAYLAGLAIGYWKGLHEIQEYWKSDKVFKPQMDESERANLTRHWGKAIRAARAYSEE